MEYRIPCTFFIAFRTEIRCFLYAFLHCGAQILFATDANRNRLHDTPYICPMSRRADNCVYDRTPTLSKFCRRMSATPAPIRRYDISRMRQKSNRSPDCSHDMLHRCRRSPTALAHRAESVLCAKTLRLLFRRETLDANARFRKQLQTEIVRISFAIDDARNAGIDDHLAADHARLMRDRKSVV